MATDPSYPKKNTAAGDCVSSPPKVSSIRGSPPPSPSAPTASQATAAPSNDFIHLSRASGSNLLSSLQPPPSVELEVKTSHDSGNCRWLRTSAAPPEGISDNDSSLSGSMNASEARFNDHNHDADCSSEDAQLLQQFWWTYDDIIILSLFAIFGIVFRMMSAAWFHSYLGVVFSEHSALSTNLPLNCWSCFLMGLLCSGRDAMGIVHSKILGGSNPHGSGRSILELGRGAYRGVIDAGRAGIHRVRGYGNLDNTSSRTLPSLSIRQTPSPSSNFINSSTGINATATSEIAGVTSGSVNTEESFVSFQSSAPQVGLHRRRCQQSLTAMVDGQHDLESDFDPSSPQSPSASNESCSDHGSGSIRASRYQSDNRTFSALEGAENYNSVSRLLGLDVFRIGPLNNSEDEIREVQLRALTRRIMASSSLVLFPAKKQDIDVMEHYQNHFTDTATREKSSGERGPQDESMQSRPLDSKYQHGNHMSEEGELQTQASSGESSGQREGKHSHKDDVSNACGNVAIPSETVTPDRGSANSSAERSQHRVIAREQLAHSPPSRNAAVIKQDPHEPTNTIEEELDQMFHSMTAHISNFRRLHVADGWDVGTSPEEMKHNILHGLRVGFCGALSTFSSWNSAMVNLLKGGHISEAIVGYLIGIQLGIISYRFGQHVAVYIFVWRCRRETKRDEARGYGIRLNGTDADENEDQEGACRNDALGQVAADQEFPSVRAIATSVFALVIISLCTALFFFPKHQQFSISLLFTPFGVLARWKLTNKYNKKLPGFPLGTFACNLLSCALSGSLGSWLSGNPGPEERIVLTSMIAGFAGSLSTLATFVVEVLSLIDPIIFKFDGLAYAVVTICWGIIIGICSSQAKNWADDI